MLTGGSQADSIVEVGHMAQSISRQSIELGKLPNTVNKS
jgi:hypothetical protein